MRFLPNTCLIPTNKTLTGGCAHRPLTRWRLTVKGEEGSLLRSRKGRVSDAGPEDTPDLGWGHRGGQRAEEGFNSISTRCGDYLQGSSIPQSQVPSC